MTPSDRRYTREHEWARLDGDLVTIGITDFAQEQLGGVVYVTLPRVGERLQAATPLGSIDSPKASSEIFSPLDGEVLEVNTDLDENPEVVNDDPYGDGWLIRIRMSSPAERDQLLSLGEYRKVLEDA